MAKKEYIKFSQVVKRNRKALKRAAVKSVGAKKGNRINSKNPIIPIIAVIAIVAAMLITLNENILKSENLPTWSGLFGFFGLTESSSELPGDGVSVHFIDVGQGDSQLIITPDFNILIDSGEKEYYPKVLSYLTKYGVESLDIVIATHPHSDHIGGLSAVLYEVKTDKVIMPNVKDEILPTTSSFMKLITAIEQNKIEVSYAKSGERIELGAGAYIDIIAPLADYDDLNNYSVVFKLTHGKNTFLFTGDIEKASENDILDSGLDVSAKVLKVAHHGSRTSSIPEFLKAVGGEYAVIGVGMPNTYNHPNDNIIENLSLYGYRILRTDINGDIVFVSDGVNLQITTDKD